LIDLYFKFYFKFVEFILILKASNEEETLRPKKN
jgi:hypothetical protein